MLYFLVVTFGFERLSYSVSEGDNSVEVVVTKISGDSARDLSLVLSTRSGTAFSLEDFTPIDVRSVTFSPGQMKQTVSIVITDDDVLEGVEEFSVTLTQMDTQASVMDSRNSTTITITDDDSECIDYSVEYDSCDNFPSPAQHYET